MKFILVLLAVVASASAQYSGESSIGGDGQPSLVQFWTRIDYKRRGRVNFEDFVYEYSEFFPAISVFESEYLAAPLDVGPFNVFENDGGVSGDTTNVPILSLAVHDIYSESDSLTLTIPFALVDSTLNYGETVQFLITVEISQNGNPAFSTQIAQTPYTYKHNLADFGAGQRMTYSANIAAPPDGSIVMVSIARDDRDSYPGAIAVPGYELTYWREASVPQLIAPK